MVFKITPLVLTFVIFMTFCVFTHSSEPSSEGFSDSENELLMLANTFSKVFTSISFDRLYQRLALLDKENLRFLTENIKKVGHSLDYAFLIDTIELLYPGYKKLCPATFDYRDCFFQIMNNFKAPYEMLDTISRPIDSEGKFYFIPPKVDETKVGPELFQTVTILLTSFVPQAYLLYAFLITAAYGTTMFNAAPVINVILVVIACMCAYAAGESSFTSTVLVILQLFLMVVMNNAGVKSGGVPVIGLRTYYVVQMLAIFSLLSITMCIPFSDLMRYEFILFLVLELACVAACYKEELDKEKWRSLSLAVISGLQGLIVLFPNIHKLSSLSQQQWKACTVDGNQLGCLVDLIKVGIANFLGGFVALRTPYTLNAIWGLAVALTYLLLILVFVVFVLVLVSVIKGVQKTPDYVATILSGHVVAMIRLVSGDCYKYDKGSNRALVNIFLAFIILWITSTFFPMLGVLYVTITSYCAMVYDPNDKVTGRELGELTERNVARLQREDKKRQDAVVAKPPVPAVAPILKVEPVALANVDKEQVIVASPSTSGLVDSAKPVLESVSVDSYFFKSGDPLPEQDAAEIISAFDAYKLPKVGRLLKGRTKLNCISHSTPNVGAKFLGSTIVEKEQSGDDIVTVTLKNKSSLDIAVKANIEDIEEGVCLFTFSGELAGFVSSSLDSGSLKVLGTHIAGNSGRALYAVKKTKKRFVPYFVGLHSSGSDSANEFIVVSV